MPGRATAAAKTRNAPHGRGCVLRSGAAVAAWLERNRQRRFLAELSDEALVDIGVSRGDAEAEARSWR